MSNPIECETIKLEHNVFDCSESKKRRKIHIRMETTKTISNISIVSFNIISINRMIIRLGVCKQDNHF